MVEKLDMNTPLHSGAVDKTHCSPVGAMEAKQDKSIDRPSENATQAKPEGRFCPGLTWKEKRLIMIYV
jgi:hypothetical protein